MDSRLPTDSLSLRVSVRLARSLGYGRNATEGISPTTKEEGKYGGLQLAQTGNFPFCRTSLCCLASWSQYLIDLCAQTLLYNFLYQYISKFCF
jgi:hypothetical protein